jgi:hypothetical protein
VSDLLGELHVETERIAEKGERLVDVLNSNPDMVEDGFGDLWCVTRLMISLAAE